MRSPPAVLAASSIRKSYDQQQVLPGVSLEVGQGEVVCLLGPSGCGKSTLAKICASLLDADAGTVSVRENAVSAPDANRLMIFQDQDQVFPWKTAISNVGFPLRLRGERNWRALALAALEEVGLSDAVQKYPYQLSGGMRQRVALARAFALKPEVLIMDEPFAGIDASRRLALQDLLSQLVFEHTQSVLFVTHEIDEAIRLADRILVMESTGHIAADISVSMERPRDPRTDQGSTLARRLFALLSAGEPPPED